MREIKFRSSDIALLSFDAFYVTVINHYPWTVALVSLPWKCIVANCTEFQHTTDLSGTDMDLVKQEQSCIILHISIKIQLLLLASKIMKKF